MSADRCTLNLMNNSASDLAIDARGLTKRFGDTQALAGIDLTARRGTVLGVLGPNGAGKTTAVRIRATLLRPDSGTALIHGYDVQKQAKEVRENIGLTGQYASVDEDLTGLENLTLIGQLLNLRTPAAKQRAKELLAWFDLSAAATRKAKTYSGGMRRRLDLAASLVGRPAVIFLDEPTTGLDPSKREEMWDVVRSLVDDGSTVLLTTQYLDEAEALADDISVIDHGRVIASGSPDELKRVVGGQTLLVRPTDLANVPAVTEILARIAGDEPSSTRTGVLQVAVKDDSALHTLVSELALARIPVTELSLRLPSLDEVFFSLTGKPVDRSESESAEGTAA